MVVCCPLVCSVQCVTGCGKMTHDTDTMQASHTICNRFTWIVRTQAKNCTAGHLVRGLGLAVWSLEQYICFIPMHLHLKGAVDLSIYLSGECCSISDCREYLSRHCLTLWTRIYKSSHILFCMINALCLFNTWTINTAS